MKVTRILEHLARGRAMTRFDAERIGDHVLPSTISALERKHGLVIDRQMVTVPGWGGAATRCARYRISSKSERDRARDVLRRMRA